MTRPEAAVDLDDAEGTRIRERPRRPPFEHAAVAVLTLLVLVVHDVGYMLREPFWLDEAWVAATARFPLSELPATTSSTPIGWSVLMRVFTPLGDQAPRLLSLLFAAAAVPVAYWLARRLDWPSRAPAVLAGALAAGGVLLVPGMLTRDDLKQYTADACGALLVLALTARLEAAWSRRGLIGLSSSVCAGMLFSHTVAAVGVAAFAALCTLEFARRAWRRLAEAAAAAVGTGAGCLAVYAVFDARSVTPGLTTFWRAYYVPLDEGLRASASFVTGQFHRQSEYFGLGPAWTAIPLVLAGMTTIWRLGRPATAVAIAALWPEMIVAAAAQRYPFLDQRTSTFLFAVTIVVAAIGVAGLTAVMLPRLKGAPSTAFAGLAILAFLVQSQPHWRAHPLPREDVRSQVRYIVAHASAQDAILVNTLSNWGFAYYWPVGHPSRLPTDVVLQGYLAYFPDQPRIVVAANAAPSGVEAAVADAVKRARQVPGGRLWLVRTHLSPGEKANYGAVFKARNLKPQPVGTAGLAVVAPD
jgi:hypothetical protein